jgi:hypothetical protein
MNEFTISLIACVLLTAGLGLCTYLFVSLKQDLHRIGKRFNDLRTTSEMQIESLRGELDSFRKTQEDLDRRTGELPQLASPIPGMNTSRRTQALRMHRRGERPEQIAAALGIARGEIELLLKMQEANIVAQPSLQV